MTRFITLDILSWIFAAGTALAAGTAAFLLLSTVARVGRELLYRRRAHYREIVRRYRNRMEEVTVGGSFRVKAFLPLLGGVLLALKTHDALLIGGFYLAVGAILTFQLARKRRGRTAEQTDELVEKLRSIWMVKPQPFAALEDASEGMTGEFKEAIDRAVDSYRLGIPAGKIWAKWRKGTPDPYLRQLVDILGWAGEAGMEEVEGALSRLEKRLVARRDVKRRAKVSLAMISGTTRFFQAANGAVLVIVPFFPYLWSFYSANLSRQLMFCVIGGWFVAGAMYMQMELERIKEKVL